MQQETPDPAREVVARTGTFSMQVTPPDVRWHYDEAGRLPAHDAVLRPLLAVAVECWAYGIDPASDVGRAAGDILERRKGKYRVRLDGDPVGGRELFWNAHGGKRGTILILVPRAEFDPARLLRGGHGVFVFGNDRTGHTPAALRFAREQVEAADLVAVCLPRNNGIEWVDIHASRDHAVGLYDAARRACGTAGP